MDLAFTGIGFLSFHGYGIGSSDTVATSFGYCKDVFTGFGKQVSKDCFGFGFLKGWIIGFQGWVGLVF